MSTADTSPFKIFDINNPNETLLYAGYDIQLFHINNGHITDDVREKIFQKHFGHILTNNTHNGELLKSQIDYPTFKKITQWINASPYKANELIELLCRDYNNNTRNEKSYNQLVDLFTCCLNKSFNDSTYKELCLSIKKVIIQCEDIKNFCFDVSQSYNLRNDYGIISTLTTESYTLNDFYSDLPAEYSLGIIL